MKPSRASVCSIGAGLALAFAMSSVAAERADADVSCTETGEKLVYECTIVLRGRETGTLLPGAAVRVKPNMPSMPMAHNIRSVQAEPGDRPGHYRARMTLDMHGEWALTMDISGPLRDRVVRKLHFGEMPAMGMKHRQDPIKPAHGEMKPGHGGMKHGHDKTKQN